MVAPSREIVGERRGEKNMSRKILLADDSLTIQKVVELTFAETDYEVISVSSGDELLECLPEAQPDIVICDVIMPGRDGYDVCQEIKSNSETLHLPVILLTGTFEPFDRDRALAAGCSEIITKPFEAKKLVEIVEHLSTATGPPPSATAMDEEDDIELDGRVTPPPPIAVPELTVEPDDEIEFDETDVRNEFAAVESAAASTDEPTVADAVQPEPDYFGEETPASETAAKSTAIEFEPDAPGKDDSFALPDIEDPPDTDEAGDQATKEVNFHASASWSGTPVPSQRNADEQTPKEEIEDPFSSEAEEQQPEEKPDDAFAPETDSEGPVQPDGPDSGEPVSVEESDHKMTTPIDVAAVMAQHNIENEPAADDEDVGSIEMDASNADTQDVTEQAEAAEESFAVETPVESFESEIPAEAVAIESPIEAFAAEMPAESSELEAEEEPTAVEAPSDAFADEVPAESFELEAPEEVMPVEPPGDPFEDEAPAESFEAEAPEKVMPVEPPGDPFEDEAPAESFEAEAPEEAMPVEPPGDPFEDEAPAESFEAEVPEKSVAVEPQAEPAAVEAARLSDDDIDRIARRLLELAGDRIENIAWDVIPDMAEIVVRERVRELEAETEQ